jgi:hypothetical protein
VHGVIEVTGTQLLSLVVSVIRVLELPESEEQEDLFDIVNGKLRDAAHVCFDGLMKRVLSVFDGHDKAMETLDLVPVVTDDLVMERVGQIAASLDGRIVDRAAFRRGEEELGAQLA